MCYIIMLGFLSIHTESAGSGQLLEDLFQANLNTVVIVDLLPPNSQKGIKDEGDKLLSLSIICTGWLTIFTSERIMYNNQEKNPNKKVKWLSQLQEKAVWTSNWKKNWKVFSYFCGWNFVKNNENKSAKFNWRKNVTTYDSASNFDR